MPIRIVTVRREGKPSLLTHFLRTHAFHLTRLPGSANTLPFPSSPALPQQHLSHLPVPPVASRPISRDAAFSRVTLHVQRFPCLGILDEGVQAGKHRHDQAVDSVAVAMSDKEGFQNRAQVMRADGPGGDGIHMLEFLLCAKGRIPHHLAQMMTDGGHAVMIERFLQPPRRSREPEVLMQQDVIIATGRPSEKTQLTVGIHTATLYPSAVKIVAPRNFISTHFMTGLVAQHAGDLVAQPLPARAHPHPQ